jgi:hypothetical protein
MTIACGFQPPMISVVMRSMMLINEAHSKLKRYNEYCLHYNLVAEGCYRKLSEIQDPFSAAYFPYLVAALITFDIGRQMGKGTRSKYDPSTNGFAAHLEKKLGIIHPLLCKLIHEDLLTISIEHCQEEIKKAYDELQQVDGGLHASNKSFHVGATKILHFLAPDLFPIVDSYAARVFRSEFKIGFRATTKPGYSSKRYIEVMKHARDMIKDYGKNEFRALEPGTPLMRVFDKIVFAHGGGWED